MTRPYTPIPARRNFTNYALMAEVVALKRARMENAGFRVDDQMAVFHRPDGRREVAHPVRIEGLSQGGRG
jgi:hypothetical protein